MSNTQHEHTWTINNDGDYARCDCGKSGYPVFIAADNERRAEQVYDKLRQNEQRFASALRVIRRKALEQVNTKSPDWAVSNTLREIAITVDYAIGINAHKEQPMSDTSQEREDQMNQHQSGTCTIPECPCRQWSAQIVAAENSRRQREASQPPAARGGGDEERRHTAEWYVGSRSESPNGDATIRAKNVGIVDWVGQVRADLADRIVREHNQHHSLVAERERLRAAIEVAIYNLNAGNDPKFLADYLQLTLDQQRGTSE